MLYELTPDIVSPLCDWFCQNARDLPWRHTRDPYAIWVSETMLQQTRVSAVIGYYTRFMKALPTVQDLANASEQTYLKLWEGLGYYRRVQNMHKAAVQVCETLGGRMPSDYPTLLTLPGIGDYTAGAVASIAAGAPVPAVDGNVLRVVARLTADSRSIDTPAVRKAMRAQVENILPQDTRTFNQALMELGALICVPNGKPLCADCPVQHLCVGYSQGVAPALPQRSAKKQRKIEERTVLLVRYQHTIALCKRPEGGLLSGLWEFPNVDGTLSVQEVKEMFDQTPPFKILKMRPHKHIFTHIQWHMTGYYIELSKMPTGKNWVWCDLDALKQTYAIPSAFQPFLKHLARVL